MASFDLAYSFLLPDEDTTPPTYQIVHDPVPKRPNPNNDPAITADNLLRAAAQAISGINSYYWPKWYAAIAAVAPPQRAEPVKSFYRTNYWTHWLQSLNSSRIAAMVLDASVNQGAGWGCKLLQRACGAEDDGQFGSATVAAANSADLNDMVRQFVVAREERYREIGGASLASWLIRASKIPDFN